jgi:hypothetical protein
MDHGSDSLGHAVPARPSLPLETTALLIARLSPEIRVALERKGRRSAATTYSLPLTLGCRQSLSRTPSGRATVMMGAMLEALLSRINHLQNKAPVQSDFDFQGQERTDIAAPAMDAVRDYHPRPSSPRDIIMIR